MKPSFNKYPIDNLFRKELRNYKRKPSDELWEKIQKDLMKPTYVAKRKYPLRYVVSIAALLVLLLGSVVIYLNVESFNSINSFSSINTKKNLKVFAEKKSLNNRTRPENTETHLNVSSRTPINNKYNTHTSTITNSKKTNIIHTHKSLDTIKSIVPINENIIQTEISTKLPQQIIDNNPIITHNNPSKKENLLYLPMALPSRTLNTSSSSTLTSNPSFTVQEINQVREKLLDLKGYYIGAEMQTNNTWVLTNNTENKQLYKTTQIKTLNYITSFTYGGGIKAGYDFNSKIGIETKILRNTIAQNYTESNEGATYKRAIILKYIQVPVYFKYKWSRLSSITKGPLVMNYKMGLQYSYLHNAQWNLNTELLAINNLMNKHNLGLTMGIDYDIYINKHLFINTGVQGLYESNIKEFPYIVNESEQKTNNFSVGINASINYKFGKN